MVQEVDAPSRRQRNRETRRDAFLQAARDVIDESGLGGLTIKSVADRLDCAVGTIYTYFPSKDSLLAEVQIEAIERLGMAYTSAAGRIEGLLSNAGITIEAAAIGRLVAFGRCTVCALEVFPKEFKLQQMLLHGRTDYDDADLARVATAAFSVLAQPERLLREAARLGAISEGDAFNRTLTWVAAVSGVLTLGRLEGPGTELVDVAGLADALHLDLISGWGADREALEAAAAAVTSDSIRSILKEGV